MARVTLEGGLTMELAVMVKAMPRGVASLAVGLPGQEAIRLPSWARLSGSGR